MVKFAKFVPDKDMNDLCLSDAYNFVVHTQQTAPEEDSGGDNSTYSHNYE
jgi:hypothetical protein